MLAQVLSGLPTVTVLTCIEEEQQLVQAIEGLVDLLHKQLKASPSCHFRSRVCWQPAAPGRALGEKGRGAAWAATCRYAC